jgi:DNA-binding transcriptional MerR regulator
MPSASCLSASAAAHRLGISIKALRLYEKRGLLAPGRTPAGYRAYGPAVLDRAAQIVALRGLGLSLAQIARVMASDPSGLDRALAAHQQGLANQMQKLASTLGRCARFASGASAHGRCHRIAVARYSLQIPAAATCLQFDRGALK